MSRAAAIALAALLSAAPVEAKTTVRSGERIDLNRASVADLMRLPNVGRKRAEAILAQRGRRPFKRVEDVAGVKGISAAWVAKNRALLTVGSTASAQVARSH